MDEIKNTNIRSLDILFRSPEASPELKFTIQESMRKALIHVQKKDDIPSRIAITSALSGEGTTSISLALGATLASDYQAKVVIVDLNWHSSQKLNSSGTNVPGVIDILNLDVRIEEVLQETDISNLSFLSAGDLETNKRPVIARGNALQNLIKYLDERFDHLILDVPAILSTSDAVPLASLGEACLLVIQQGATSIEDVRNALAEIDHLPMLGVVFNQVSYDTPALLRRLLTA